MAFWPLRRTAIDLRLVPSRVGTEIDLTTIASGRSIYMVRSTGLGIVLPSVKYHRVSSSISQPFLCHKNIISSSCLASSPSPFSPSQVALQLSPPPKHPAPAPPPVTGIAAKAAVRGPAKQMSPRPSQPATSTISQSPMPMKRRDATVATLSCVAIRARGPSMALLRMALRP